jgi:nucleoside triphosphate pyrophosphatase
MTSRRIVLASGSPRRRELLALLGVEFTASASDIDEALRAGEQAVELVTRLAYEKAVVVAATHPDAVVVGADTAVEVDGAILGKPVDADDARRMLRTLSGRTHVVHTAVAVAADGGVAMASTSSAVTFATLTDADIEWYLATGEPFDKAGAYALQGAGGVFVTTVTGSVSGVLGLPLHETAALLNNWGRIVSDADTDVPQMPD